MQTGKSIVVVVVLGIVFSIVRAENKPSVPGTGYEEAMGGFGMGPSEPPAASEEPMSIFNDEVRLFKFRMDHLNHHVADVEEAMAFMERYKGKDNPPIIGAFPDAKTNSLCVVGPPEAENAIRRVLAQSIIEVQGIFGPNLSTKLRKLRGERVEILTEMAVVEMVLVEEKQKEKIRDRLSAFQTELTRIEKQIEIGEKYLQRIQEVPQ